MLFVGIDQHKRHSTICVRDEQGAIALRRQVSTKWEEVDRFLASLRERPTKGGLTKAALLWLNLVQLPEGMSVGGVKRWAWRFNLGAEGDRCRSLKVRRPHETCCWDRMENRWRIGRTVE